MLINGKNLLRGVMSGNDQAEAKTNILPVTRTYTPPLSDKEYLLVDGYNVIFAWDELNELARDNVDGARGRLLDILCDYQECVDVN